MNRKAYLAAIFIAVLCLLTSGCFSIEQEIFLKPDGSGDMVVYLSMLDNPEEMKKDSPSQDPLKLFDEFKQKFANDLPPTIKLKEAKEVRRHGANAPVPEPMAPLPLQPNRNRSRVGHDVEDWRTLLR